MPESTAAAALEHLEKNRGTKLSINEIAEAIGKDYTATAAALSYMFKHGKVRRTSPGVYAIKGRATATTDATKAARPTRKQSRKQTARRARAPRATVGAAKSKKFEMLADHPKTGSVVLQSPEGDLYLAHQIEL